MHFARFGPLSITPANLPLSVRSPGAPARTLISCRIDRTRFQNATGLGGEWDDAELAACLDVRGETITAGLKRLAREADAPGFASDLLVDGIGVVMMVEIARYLRGAHERPGLARGGLSPWQLRRVTGAIEGAEGVSPSLTELAGLCGIGPRHLMRAFRQSTGRTITDWAEDARTRRAIRLLAQTGLPIAEIATQLGFASISGFSHAFHRAIGEPPSSFRRRNRV
jgi:AraC family transcriptional regulator